MSGIGTGISDIGSGISSLFSAGGAADEASAYTTAASIAEENVMLTNRSTAIQEQQEQRQITQAIGTEQTDVAGAGMTSGGSASDLMRSSLQQGALSKQLIANQGEITAQGYAYQSSAYTGQAKAASAQSKGDTAGGILGIVGGLFGL